METGLSVFNQALKYLELERTVNYGSAILKYYDLQKDDVLIIFHNIGINPATIDAAEEAKKRSVKIIAVSSEAWQKEMPEDHFIRHPNKKNLFDYADVCIEDFNPVGDAVVNVPGLDTPIAPISNIIDFYIAHLLEIETVKQCIDRGITPPEGDNKKSFRADVTETEDSFIGYRADEKVNCASEPSEYPKCEW